MSGTILIADYEALDVVLLCHAALAQDSPESPEYSQSSAQSNTQPYVCFSHY